MNISQTNCPECGEYVAAEEACPHCGAAVEKGPEAVLDVGEQYTFRTEGSAVGGDVEELETTVEIDGKWAEHVSRTVYTARIVSSRGVEDGESFEVPVPSLRHSGVLVESMTEASPRGLEELPGEGTLPLRRPIGEDTVEGRPIYLYRNDAGISLAELVAVAERSLSIRHVNEVFSAVLEALSDFHDVGILHLFLHPELVRVRPRGTEKGVPVDSDGEDQRAVSPESREEDLQAETSGREGGEQEWKVTEYDETRPQEPLGRRISDVDAPDLSSLSEESSSLGEETSEVNDEEMVEENWLRRIGLGPEDRDGSSTEKDQHVSDSRSDSAERPDEGLALELEVLVDSISGLFSRDDLPDDPDVVPGFSPPEMYADTSPSLDTTSDVFSAGMTLYYLIAGRRPPASVYTNHRPAIPALNFRPDFPPGLGPVVKRATRSDPEMRYPDVASMKSALGEALHAIEDRRAEHRDELPGVDVAVDRHVGVAKRERNPVNQDNVFEGVAEDGKFGMIIVADGVSTASYGSGEIASELLIEVGAEVWNELLPAYLMDEPIDEVASIQEILEETNERIVEYVNERHTPFSGNAHEVMGTTALVAIYCRGTVTLGAIGDSRGYLQRGPGLEQLTVDHNLWTLSVLEGLPPDEALSMPRSDALARCLGTFVLDDQELEAVSPGYEISQFAVAEGDTLLLTTDGLIDFAGGNVISAEENIQATLLAEPDPALACLELILLANRGGGGDNIGLGVAQFE